MAARADDDDLPSLPLSTMIHMVNIKLTATNYMLWHAQIEPLLITQRFQPFVDGSSAGPTQFIPGATGVPVLNPDYSKWYSRDQVIKLFLVSTLTEESMAVIIGCKSSREVWAALSRAYNSRSKARELSLDDLLSLKRDDSSVVDYGRRYKSLCDQLAVIGCSLDPSDKSHWFIRGLGSKFATFTAVQLTQDPLPDFDTLLARAQSHELFVRSSASLPPPAAFHAAPASREPCGNKSSSKKSHGRNNPRQRKKPWCYFCRDTGHDAFDCPPWFNRSYSRNSKPTANLAEAFSTF